MNRYSVSRSDNGTDWTPCGEVSARSLKESVLKARRRDRGHAEFWKATVLVNQSGRCLGKSVTYPASECVPLGTKS